MITHICMIIPVLPLPDHTHKRLYLQNTYLYTMPKAKPSKPKKNIPAPRNPEDFGKRLQEARATRGLSQRDLALRVHSNVTTLSRYESAGVLPSIAMAAQLAQALEISLDQLAGLAEPDTQLVALARRLSTALTPEQQAQLCAVLGWVKA